MAWVNALISSDSGCICCLRKQLCRRRHGQGKHVAQPTRRISRRSPRTFTEHYTYDRRRQFLSTTDHLGASTVLYHDGLNPRLRARMPWATNPPAPRRQRQSGERARTRSSLILSRS